MEEYCENNDSIDDSAAFLSRENNRMLESIFCDDEQQNQVTIDKRFNHFDQRYKIVNLSHLAENKKFNNKAVAPTYNES